MTTPTAGSRNPARVFPFLIITAVLVLAALAGQRPSTRFLLLGGGGLGLSLLVLHPGLGLVALAGLSFTLPLTIGTGTEIALTPPVFLILAVILAWLLGSLRKQSLRIPTSRTTLPLLLFVGSGLLSLLAGNTYWHTAVPRPTNLLLVQVGQWSIFALSAAIFLLAGSLGAQGRWLQVTTFTFLAVGSIVVLEFYLPSLRHALGWSSSNMANRGMFWTWLAALAAGQLLFNQRLKPLVRFWLLVLLAASAYAVWFPLREWASGWAPCTVSAVTVLWLWSWRRNRVTGRAVGVALIVLAVVLYPIVFVHAGGERELQISWGGRKLLYQAVLDLVKAHPILGLGPAAYRHYGHTLWLTAGSGHALWFRPNISSHNNYIDIYAQMGLVGLGLFVWFLVEVALLGRRLAPRFQGDFADGYVQGTLGGLAGTLVAMMLADWFLPFVYNIGFPGFRTSALAWMFLGGLVALEQSGLLQGGDTFTSRQ